jgi:hypothetical protein
MQGEKKQNRKALIGNYFVRDWAIVIADVRHKKKPIPMHGALARTIGTKLKPPMLATKIAVVAIKKIPADRSMMPNDASMLVFMSSPNIAT